jgi:YVTN family beta-propeller protein
MAVVCLGVGLLFPSAGRAQTAVGNLAVGTAPVALAANPVTNKIYVANLNSNNVTVIDGATNIMTTVAAGTNPNAVAVNQVTNKIYVTNETSNDVTVIDGATNATTTVPAGTWPRFVAVDPVTNKIYVANFTSGNVTVIDGSTNATTTVAAGTKPFAVALNPVTNKIYVANYGSGNVTVIDGATNATTTVVAGTAPGGAAVNPVTNKIYVANRNSNNVTVIDGVTNTTSTVATGTNPSRVAVNPVTNKIYVTNAGTSNMTVIDGATNATTTVAAANMTSPLVLVVNPLTNQVYVANISSANVTVIDGATNAATTVAVGVSPQDMTFNPVTNRVYVGNGSSNNVTVIDGATNSTTTVVAGNTPAFAAVNPATNKIYVANQNSNNVTVIDGATNTTTTVSAGTAPNAVAVNPATDKIYVANNGSNNVTVIDGATNTTTTVSAGTAPNAVAVNPITNKIYVANQNSNNVTVIDGPTNTTTTVGAGTRPLDVAVNPVTNKIYVANITSNNVTVIDGATNATTTVAAGTGPFQVAVNSVTNKIYVGNYNSSNVTVIDGPTNTTTTVAAGGLPYAVAVNPVTNKIYVANYGSANVTVIDGATNTTTMVAAGNSPQAAAVNPVTNKIYVVNTGSNNVTVIDGATNTTTTVSAGTIPRAVAVNPVTNAVYVSNQNSNNVTVITEQQVHSIPLSATVTPLGGDQTVVTAAPPIFTFTTSSTFSPQATTPDAVFYQVDTWQGPWLMASGSSNTFTGQIPAEFLGTHILYAYATDGQEGTSINAVDGLGPVIGNIIAYVFTVVPASTTTSVTADVNPSAPGNNVNFTAYVAEAAPGASIPGGSVTFMNGAATLGTVALDGTGHASFATSSLAIGSHSITVVYNGDVNDFGSTSPALTQTVQATPPTISLSFGGASIALNGTTTLTFTISNPNVSTTLNGVGFVDNLPPGLVVGPGPSAGSCGSGTLSAALGASSISFSGVTLAPGASCWQYVEVQGTTAGVKNTNAAATSNEGGTGSPGSASLTVNQATPTITWSNPVAIVYGTALSATQLNATASVPGTFAYTPAASTVLGAGPQTLSVTFTPTDSADYTSVTQTASLTVSQAAPAITWSNPAAITYGAPLSATQLNATSSAPGAFVYTPAAGTVLGAGSQTLTVSFTPTDSTDYTSATQTVSLTVNQATPTMTWANPAAITYGAPLSATQLNATSSVPGAFVYTPAAGTVLSAGTQTLNVSFTPTDSTDYTTAIQTVSLTVNKATPTITWANPAVISYGTALSTTQLNAAASVPGTLAYTPSAGAVLGAGPQTLSVSFTPTDSTDYTSATQTVSLTVIKATPSIAWSNPAAINYGTSLSATQLNANASVPGAFIYTPAAGTVLGVGPQTLSVSFTPSDSADYTSATQTVSLTVNKAAPTIIWANPTAITYGTALSTTQLNATFSVPGTFVYTPPAGAVLGAGPQTLSVSFTPADSTDYTPATQTVSLTVNQATPAITWSNPAAITYGTPLSATQLNAIASVPGTFVYTPSAGAVLSAGPQTLGVSFTPADSADYSVATQNASLTVNQAATGVTVSSSPGSINQGMFVTFTASVTASGLTPVGTVSFVDGTTTLGTGTLNGGTATFTTSALAVGSHSITAVFAGSANFAGSTSTAVAETVLPPDFSLSMGQNSSAIKAGQTATFTVNIAPLGSFNGPVTFSASGLPPEATFSATPSPLQINGASATATLTVTTTAPQAATAMPSPGKPGSLMAMLVSAPFMAIVLAAVGRRARRGRKLRGVLVPVCLAFALLLVLSGCGGRSSTSSGNGNPGTPAGSYTVTVTAGSGTTQHSTTLTVVVQ